MNQYNIISQNIALLTVSIFSHITGRRVNGVEGGTQKEKTFLNLVCRDEDVGDAAVVVRCLCDDARVLTQAEEENPDYFMLII